MCHRVEGLVQIIGWETIHLLSHIDCGGVLKMSRSCVNQAHGSQSIRMSLLKGPCNVFFIIAIERLHVQKDILQITLIISTDKYEKKK